MRTAGLGALLRDAARLDRTQSDPRVAVRNAIGVAAPLAIGQLTVTAAAGLPATIGALQTAFADRPGPYRLRMLRMLGTACAAAVTSSLAVLVSRNEAAALVLLFVLSFGAGLLLSGGPAATQVGVASVAVALILGHIPQSPGHAVVIGLLVLAGGAGQALLAIAAWPLGRHAPERRALAGLYRELATTARQPSGPAAGPQAGAVIDTVRTTLYGLGHDHGASVEAYRVLLDQAQRIRREVIVLAALLERLAGEDAVGAGLVRAAVARCGDVLTAIGDALDSGRRVDPTTVTAARSALRRATDRFTDESGLTARATAARLRALSGQLRAAIETTATGASEGRQGEVHDLAGGPSLRDPIEVLRANLSPDSAVFRHAVRLAVLVTSADLVVRAAGFTHGYWVPLTILVVLRPDFGSTFQRAAGRVIGTIVGLLLATELLHWVPGGTWYLIALIGVFFFGVRLAGPGNVGLSAVALSGLVVVLLALNGVAPRDTLVERAVATAVGGALALVAVLLLPVWERQFVPGRLADLVTAYQRYLAAITDPDADVADRQAARAASRLARSNAQASVDRARAEPVSGRAAVELGEAVLANSHRLVHALMTIDSVRGAAHQADELPGLAELLGQADAALGGCATALRTGTAPKGVPVLRPAQERLHEALGKRPALAGGPDSAGAIDDASDRLANSIDTLVDAVRRQSAVPGPPVVT